jgi:hypothetical protein
MEVTGVAVALPATTYGEARVTRAEARVPEDVTSLRARGDATSEHAALPPAQAREANVVKALEAAREAREERERLVNATAGGSFQFEMEGRTRVMKVLDSRDVLIYQVPPQGVLELIEARDQEPPSHIRTSV